MKLQYGNTWWGSEWLKALEEADHANRLPRGRVYARGGAVISMHREGETLSLYLLFKCFEYQILPEVC